MRDIVGVNNTGLAFNSVVAVELNDGHPMNPMVNAGAIATTALMPGATAVEQWERVREGLSAFAGRPLSLDGVVYASEAQTNDRNRALACPRLHRGGAGTRAGLLPVDAETDVGGEGSPDRSERARLVA